MSPIAQCARSYIGTRFHHQGRLKKTDTHKGGIDCLGLLVCVAAELDLLGEGGICLASLDERDYSYSPDAIYLTARLTELLTKIPPGGIQPDDVLLLTIDNQPQHLAIVSALDESLGIIHAYAPARAVVEHRLDDSWRARIHAAFRI